MTAHHIFARPFAALSAVLTLAIGIAMTAVPSTARAESDVFSAFVDDSDDASFMDYTDDDCMSSLTSRQAGAATTGALPDASKTAATVPAPTILAPAKPTVNIIMRDGGICDPIRHMGC